MIHTISAGNAIQWATLSACGVTAKEKAACIGSALGGHPTKSSKKLESKKIGLLTMNTHTY
jgi:hypothetical protein